MLSPRIAAQCACDLGWAGVSRRRVGGDAVRHRERVCRPVWQRNRPACTGAWPENAWVAAALSWHCGSLGGRCALLVEQTRLAKPSSSGRMCGLHARVLCLQSERLIRNRAARFKRRRPLPTAQLQRPSPVSAFLPFRASPVVLHLLPLQVSLSYLRSYQGMGVADLACVSGCECEPQVRLQPGSRCICLQMECPVCRATNASRRCARSRVPGGQAASNAASSLARRRE